MAGFPIEVATRIKTLPPYLFAAIDKMKQAAIARGVDIINLGIGDPDLPTPTPVIDSLAQAERERMMKEAHREEIREKNLSRNVAIASGLLLFAIAAGLLQRYRFIRRSKAAIERERDRSEELLLNILPEEIGIPEASLAAIDSNAEEGIRSRAFPVIH